MAKKQKRPFVDLRNAIPLYRIGNNGFAVAKDGSLTIGFKIELPELDNLALADFAAGKDESGQGKNLLPTLDAAIRNLPEGYVFHQQDIFYYDKPNNLPDDGTYLSSTQRKFFHERELLRHVCYFFITGRSVSFKEAKFDDKSVKSFQDHAKIFESSIYSFAPQQLTDNDWVDYLESFFSVDFTNSENKELRNLSFDDASFGSDMLVGYAISSDKCITEQADLDSIRQNTKRSTPSAVQYNSYISSLCWDVPCAKVVNNIIVREKTKTIYENIKVFESQVGVFKWLKRASDNAKEFLSIMDADNGYAAAYHHFNAFFFIPQDKKTFVQDEIRKSLGDLKVNPVKLSPIELEDVFLASIGGCTSKLVYPVHLYPMFLDEALCFTNLETCSRQYRNGILFCDTRDTPVVVDLFDAPIKTGKITNWNAIVVGPSGTGKSVTTNFIFSQLYNQGHQLIIIDIQHSYRPLCQLLGGKYIDLGEGDGQKNMSFNPFLIDMVDVNNIEEKKKIVESVESIRDVLFMAWSLDEKSDKIENTNSQQTLFDLLMDFYARRYEQQKEFVSFDDFYNFLKEKHESGKINTRFFDAESFLHVTKKYKKDDVHGYLLNGEDNLFIDDIPFIVFEMSAVQTLSIFPLILSLTVIYCRKVIDSTRSKFKVKDLILDECWKFLEIPRFGRFIRFQYKTIRKMGGAIITIVQQLSDILKTEYANDIVANANTIYFLSHEGKEAQIINHQKDISLSKGDLDRILSMKINSREVAIRQGTYTNKYKVQLTPEQLALFNTNAGDRTRLQQIYSANGKNMAAAIAQYLEEREEKA